MNICEAYQKKLAISEQVYAKEHGGKELSESKKIAIARVLANTSEYITEAFENSAGTQLSNMKTFKKFCLDLTTVALPSLIANDLVIVYPMKSRTGYIQYLQFKAGSNKGAIAQGDLFNDPFRLGAMSDDRVAYTAAVVSNERIDLDASAGTTGKNFIWTPANNPVDSNGKHPTIIVRDLSGNLLVEGTNYNVVADSDGNGYGIQNGGVAYSYLVSYRYDNVIIPQNDIPALVAGMEGISLEAKARRISIYYSQMAAFQAKTEMGIDLGEVLATQACGELAYEIDTEVVKLLADNATAYDDLTWNKKCPWGVSKRDHYAGFAEIIELASQHIYDATQKHAANYLIVASNIKPILVMIEGFKAANTSKINGPYFAGELNGVKVYVSPMLKSGVFVAGYNGGDMITSAAVYAPYMAIVPTQLLGFADGGMNQGFSTLYDLKLLNKALLVQGKVVEEEYTVQTHAA